MESPSKQHKTGVLANCIYFVESCLLNLKPYLRNGIVDSSRIDMQLGDIQ